MSAPAESIYTRLARRTLPEQHAMMVTYWRTFARVHPKVAAMANGVAETYELAVQHAAAAIESAGMARACGRVALRRAGLSG